MATTEEQLRNVLQDIAKKEGYVLSKIDIKPMSSGGANYTTDLFLATISEPLKPDINIFAKAANLSEEARKTMTLLSGVYETEAIFYSELAVYFEEIYRKHQVPTEDRMAIPKYYGHVLIPLEEILVLENLEARGFKNFDRMKTFHWEYAVAAVTQMARFHALSLAFRDENPAEFERIISHFNFDYGKDQEMMNTILQTALRYGCESLQDDDKQRFLNFFSSIEKQSTTMTKAMADKKMLIHTDFRPSNLMHRRRNGKLEVITLDFQTLRMGNPVLDLLYFIFSGSDEEFRRLHYQNLLDHYFTQLTLALQQVKIDVEIVYPRKTFEADLIEMRPMGLLLGLMIVGGVTVAAEDLPKLDGDLGSMQIKPNQLAQERISGIVKDYIRWEVI